MAAGSRGGGRKGMESPLSLPKLQAAVSLLCLFGCTSFDHGELEKRSKRSIVRGREAAEKERGRMSRAFLQEKKKGKKKCTCDKLCYQETTHHYPWAWGSVSRNESNRKSTVGERNGRAWPVERDHARGMDAEEPRKIMAQGYCKNCRA